jgi:hypothetical protein
MNGVNAPKAKFSGACLIPPTSPQRIGVKSDIAAGYDEMIRSEIVKRLLAGEADRCRPVS